MLEVEGPVSLQGACGVMWCFLSQAPIGFKSTLYWRRDRLDGQTDARTDMGRQTDKQTGSQAGRDRKTGIKMDRETNRLINIGEMFARVCFWFVP